MSKSGVTALGAVDVCCLSCIIPKFAGSAILATGLVMAVGISSAQSATMNLTQGLPDNVSLDNEFEAAWWGEWTGRSNVPAKQEALEGLEGAFASLAMTDSLMYGLSGGQDTAFTYSGVALQAVAIKSGSSWTAILFNAPKPIGAITALNNEISQVVGFGGATIIPIALPQTAILFLTGLLGIAILGRGRDRWAKRSSGSID